jgi:FSR family fosmidomycin resistance protein-like MFS transporter
MVESRSTRPEAPMTQEFAAEPHRPRAVRTKPITLVLASAHGVNDAYAAFLLPLLPRLMGELGLSVTLASALAMVLSLTASLAQPLLGWIADLLGRHWFVILGPVATGVFMSLIGSVSGFWALVTILVLAGLGSAAFHPPAASMATDRGRGPGRNLNFSLFTFGGAAGYAAGPVIAVALVALWGIDHLWLAMPPALIVGGILLTIVPRDARPQAHERPPSFMAITRLLRGPLGLTFGIGAASAFLQRLFLTFEPMIIAEAGGSEASGGFVLSVYLSAQALGTLGGGYLADRLERRRLLAILTGISFQAHFLALLLAPGSASALTAVIVAGFVNMAVVPPIGSIAQELIPTGAAVSYGIVMGLAWAVGSLGVVGTGVLSDSVGAQAGALMSTPVILLATVFALRLRSTDPTNA